MVSTQWSLGRILIIWCFWFIFLVALLFTIVRFRGGIGLDLVHSSSRILALAFLVAPPVVATLLWGRKQDEVRSARAVEPAHAVDRPVWRGLR
jgi:hypothetical protein